MQKDSAHRERIHKYYCACFQRAVSPVCGRTFCWSVTSGTTSSRCTSLPCSSSYCPGFPSGSTWRPYLPGEKSRHCPWWRHIHDVAIGSTQHFLFCCSCIMLLLFSFICSRLLRISRSGVLRESLRVQCLLLSRVECHFYSVPEPK